MNKSDRVHPDAMAMELDTMLDSLAVPQLLDVAAALGRSDSVPPLRQKEDLVEALKRLASAEQLGLAVHRTEALAPFKHAFLFQFHPASQPEQTIEELSTALSPYLSSFTPVNLSDAEFKVQTCLVDHRNLRVVLKLVHVVTTVQLEPINADEFRRVKTRVRHPVVVLLRLQTGLASISFPGFTQGAATPNQDRISYEDIARSCASIVTEKTGVVLEGLPIKPSIEALVAAQPAEVLDRGRAVRGRKGGRMVFDCHGTKDDTSALISKLLKVGVDEKVLKETLRELPSDEMWLEWTRLQIHTKVSFGEFAPQVLFVWGRGGSSASHLEYVIAKLSPAEVNRAERSNEAARYLDSLPIGDIVRASDLMQHFGMSRDESMAALTSLVSTGHFDLRFRVRTSKRLLDYDNLWNDSLETIPLKVIDEDENEIVITEPKNIEIGYERVR